MSFQGKHHTEATKRRLSKDSRLTGRPPSHGHAGSHKKGSRASPTYQVWANMRSRCRNPKDKYFKDYGGRGIRVCLRWSSFEDFLADMGERPKGLTLDRKDNDKGYYKTNCRWATPTVQHNNTRANRLVTMNGVTLSVAQMARRYGLTPATVFSRLYRGIPLEDAFSPAKWTGKRASMER